MDMIKKEAHDAQIETLKSMTYEEINDLLVKLNDENNKLHDELEKFKKPENLAF